MKPILSKNYHIYFEKEGFLKLNEFINNNTPSTVFILVDENTNKNCLPVFLSHLNISIPYKIIEIQSGEAHKNMQTCNFVWGELTKLGADRKSLLINLGGGVITDLGGFVASTFKRGISFINIPTTLLSMVDASVGGKTGVDLGVLKNQIGLFANPEMVLVFSPFLKTVNKRELLSGLAEIIKYGLTFDVQLWEEIKSMDAFDKLQLNELIYRSIAIKNEVVIKDPKEKNVRKALNYGHTLGHAIESYFLASETKENLTHGEAIAIGMITEAYISSKLLNFPIKNVIEIKNVILEIFGKTSFSKEDYNEIMQLLIHDKKNVGGQVNFVLLTDYEQFKLNCVVEESLIIEALQYYSS